MRRAARLTAALGILTSAVLFVPQSALGGADVLRDSRGDIGVPEFDLVEVGFGRFPPNVRGGRLWILYVFDGSWTMDTLQSNFSGFVGTEFNTRRRIQVGSQVHAGEEQHLYFDVDANRQFKIDYFVTDDGSFVQVLPQRARRDLRNAQVLGVFTAVLPQEDGERMTDFIDGEGFRTRFMFEDDFGFAPPEPMEEVPEEVPEDEVAEEETPDVIEEEEPELGVPLTVVDDEGINQALCWGGGLSSGALGIGAAFGVGRRWRDRPRGQRYTYRLITGAAPSLALGLTSAAFGEPELGLALSLPYAGTYGLAWGSTRVWEPAHIIKKGFGWNDHE